MFMSLHFPQLSFPTLGSVDASFRMAHALGGSTREQSHVPRSCNKGLCSATRQHWRSSSLPKMQMPPSLPTFPSHSQTQFWPFAQADNCSHLTHEWVQLTNYRMHPSNPRLLPADGAELASHWQQHQCNRRSRSARLEVVHPVGSIEILECVSISEDLATSAWQSKNSWGVAVCILPLTPTPS